MTDARNVAVAILRRFTTIHHKGSIAMYAMIVGKNLETNPPPPMATPEKTTEQSSTYRITVVCINCGEGKSGMNGYSWHQYTVEVPKGMTVRHHLQHTPCRKCGCNKLERID